MNASKARISDAASKARISDAFGGIAHGLRAALRGYLFILTRRRLLVHYVMSVLRLLVVTAGLSSLAWLSLLLPRWLGLVSLSIGSILERVARVMLFLAQFVAPANFRTLFWITLGLADEAAAKRLEELPLVRGLRATLVSIALQLLRGAVAAAAFALSLPFWLPTMATSVAVFIYATPLALLALLPLALGLTIIVANGGHRTALAALAAFSTLSSLAPALLAAALVAAAMCGLLSWASLDSMVRAACAWLLCSTLAQQSLAPYSARQDARAWAGWAGGRTWLLAGFGLPSCLAVRYAHPLVGLSVLELTHGAAAVLLAAELEAEASSAAAGHQETRQGKPAKEE